MKRLLAFAGPVLLLAAVTSTARASSVTYTYTGNDYTIAGPPWTTSMFISASLTFASPLPDNLSGITTETSNVESWTVNDGVYTYSNGQAASYETYIFAFGTGPSGNITSWNIEVIEGTGKPQSVSDYTGPTYGADLSTISSSGCGVYPQPECYAVNDHDPGVWTVTTNSTPSSNVPEPSPAALISLAGPILLLARRRINRNA